MVNAPLFAKTTTFAASSAVLAKPPARDAGWLRQAAAPQATTATDHLRWASACSQGLKPLAVTQHQFTALRPQCAARNSFWNGTFTRSAPGSHPQATP